MKTEDVRFLTVNVEKGRVVVNLKNGKSVMRFIEREELIEANRISREKGAVARIEYIVELINTKYNKLEWPKPAPLCAEDERFFELKAMRDLGGLPIEEEKEYQELLNL